MSQAEVVSTQNYLDKISQLDRQHAKRLKKVRMEALHDESLPDLDRAVLGLAGDPQKLEFYKALGKRVGNHIGKPVISVLKSSCGSVKEASGGFISGDLQVSFGKSLSANEDDPIVSAYLKIPVKKPVSYLRTSHLPGDTEHIYFDGDTTLRDRELGGYAVEHTALRPDYHRSPDENGDRSLLVHTVGDISIGRQAIYGHPLFSAGVSRLLQALEDRK